MLFLNRIAMDSSAIIFLGILISVIPGSAATNDVNPPHRDNKIAEFIKTSCDLTDYPELCVSSLSSYEGSVKPTLSEMAKATAYVSLVHVRNASFWASGVITRNANLSQGEREALGNCIENFQDIADELRGSLEGLNHLRRNAFDSQMDDLLSGMNAAFTDEDSCKDGFKNEDGEVKAMVQARTQNLHRLISNALSLVSALAATGIAGNGIDV